MLIFRVGRITGLFLFLILATPLVLPLAARNHSKPEKEKEQVESPEFAIIVNHLIASENKYSIKMRKYSPRVETYLQYYVPDPTLGDMTRNDSYYLGRLNFGAQEQVVSFKPDSTGEWLRRHGQVRAQIRSNNLALEPLEVDADGFDRERYTFTPVRWEYLGDIRCLAIDIHPRPHAGIGAFEGRIWVEDHDYSIVRMNGARTNPPRYNFYTHFDCWRENLQPGLWLPVYIYSQESNLGSRLRYKAETRIWGYDLNDRNPEQEWTNIQVDAPAPIRDSSEATTDMPPIESQRLLTIDAEQNVLRRLDRARLLAPPGPVDKVLETVVNNLRVSNHLESLPPVHCRVMLTSTLESFSLAYTIVLSRGLIDVLPDEASLAMVLAHELAHVAGARKIDTMFAFNDVLQVPDEGLQSVLDVARDREDEADADARGIEFLKNSPYKDSLAQAGLFLRAAAAAAPYAPHLFGPHLGNGLTEGSNKLLRMAALIEAAPELTPKNINQIAALPLGSRVQVNAWDGSVSFTTRKAVPLVDASEKMPFRVTPVIPYLRTYLAPSNPEVSAQNQGK